MHYGICEMGLSLIYAIISVNLFSKGGLNKNTGIIDWI